MNNITDKNVTCFNEDMINSTNNKWPPVNIVFAFLYSLLFVVSLSGNTLVITVVIKNKAMQTVTHFFICNLALSDIMVTLTSLWITPLYAFMETWIWGRYMCNMFPLFQGSSTFISTLTLLAIAIDRYTAILYLFQRNMTKFFCLATVTLIWLSSILLTLPYATHMMYIDDGCKSVICTEMWPNDVVRVFYGMCVLLLQFGLPLGIIGFCYTRIWWFIVNRKSSVHQAGVKRTDNDARKRQKLIKMLIAMVTIFALCWLPVNVMNILRDFLSVGHVNTPGFVYTFVGAHFVSMSATCWNPILYAWLNEKFRHEFGLVLAGIFKLEAYCSRFVKHGSSPGRKIRKNASVKCRRPENVDYLDECILYTEEEYQQATPTSMVEHLDDQATVNNSNDDEHVNYVNFFVFDNI